MKQKQGYKLLILLIVIFIVPFATLCYLYSYSYLESAIDTHQIQAIIDINNKTLNSSVIISKQSTAAVPSPFVKSLFYGILTMPAKVDIRMLIRTMLKYQQPQDLNNITVRFIIATPRNKTYIHWIQIENDTFHDIILLERIYENMNGGKTYEYFRYIAYNKHWLGRYQYIGKFDDDTFTNFRNLNNFINNKLRNMNDVFFGKCLTFYNNQSNMKQVFFDDEGHITLYMTGCCYGMSMDVVEYIVSNKSFAYRHRSRSKAYHLYHIADTSDSYRRALGEDALASEWILRDHKGNNTACFTKEQVKLDYYHCRDAMRFIDFCSSRGAYRLSRNTIHIHYVKTYQAWMALMKLFYGKNFQLMPIPSNLVMFDKFHKYKELISNMDTFHVPRWILPHI